MHFDVTFEDAILGEALRAPEFLSRAWRVLEGHHFSGRPRIWLWTAISARWKATKELLTPSLAKAALLRDVDDDDKRAPYLELLIRLYRSPPRSPAGALEELVKFAGLVDLQIGLERAAESLEKGDVDAARKAITPTLVDRRLRRYSLVSWFEEFDERQAAREHEAKHPETFKVVPTGWKRVDAAMSGGARGGELGLIMGTTGRGKSIGLNNIAMAALKRKFNVAHFAFEMPASQVATRADSLWTSVPYNRFKSWSLAPSDLELIRRRRASDAARFTGKYKIASFPVRTATVQDLVAALDDFIDEFGWRPDVLIVDSADHLISRDFKGESFRIQQADVYWAVKGLAEERKLVAWSSVHAGREWAARTATAEATSESYDKARIADTVISLNEPNKRRHVEVSDDAEEDTEELEDFAPEPAKLELFLAKYRDGESRLKVAMNADFTRMRLAEV